MNYIKNIEKSKFEFKELSHDISVFINENITKLSKTYFKNSESRFVQFHFCLSKQIKFLFKNQTCSQILQENEMILLYNPNKDLSINSVFSSKAICVSILIDIQKLHELFANHTHDIEFFQLELTQSAYYKKKSIQDSLLSVLHEIRSCSLPNGFYKLYLKAKVYELICIYFFHKDISNRIDCPFLSNEETLLKIRKVKRLLIEKLDDPPSVSQLSSALGINQHRLTSGFKKLYGKTIYSFLLDYKLMTARNILKDSQLRIKDLSYQLGYESTSHFISAFKRKFGITPKQYVKSLLNNNE